MSLALVALLLAAAPAPADETCRAPPNGVTIVGDEHIAGVTVARAVDTFFSERFNAALGAKVGARSRELLRDRVLADGTRERRVRVRLPPVAPLLALAPADELFYDEVTHYDPRTREARFFIVTAACDRVKYGGTLRFREVDGGTQLHVDATLDIDAPFGGLVEGLVRAAVRDSYATLAAMMQAWPDERVTLARL